MRVVVAMASLLVIAVGSASGQQQPPAPQPEAQITALEHRIERAVTQTDTLFLDSVYAPDFRFKHGTGELQDRAAWLASVRASRGRFLARDLDSLDVEVHGDVALTTGRIHVRRLATDSTTVEYTIRYARVYVRRRGRWQLLTHHSTQQTAGPLAAP
jgi:ketosteroid isomerase-like protein